MNYLLSLKVPAEQRVRLAHLSIRPDASQGRCAMRGEVYLLIYSHFRV